MQDPPNRVVDELGLGVRLVAALVRAHPDAGHWETRREGVECPPGHPEGGVGIQTGQVEVLWRDQRVNQGGDLIYASDEDEVPDAIRLLITLTTRV